MDQNNYTHNSDSLSDSSIQQDSTTPQVGFLEALKKLRGLGLKLTATEDILEEIEELGVQQQLQNPNFIEQLNSSPGYYSSAKPTSKDIFIYQTTNKVKAEKFPISSLKIGSWEIVTRNEDDLVAKFYFARRKVVWEILEDGFKRKIEIEWDDISALKTSKQENQFDILEIELKAPPSFHHETDPQPRRHSQWRIIPDFTGGQALTFRRHWLNFSPKVIDEPLVKLLRHDNRLCQLIQQGFPFQNSPYFDFSFDFGEKGYVNLEQQQQQQQQQQQFSISYVPASNHHMTRTYMNDYHSPVPEDVVMPLWDRRMNTFGDGFSNDEIQICNPVPLMGQGMNNNVTDSTITHQVGGMSFATLDAEMIRSMNQLVGLDDLRNTSLNNSQIEFSEDIYLNGPNNMIANSEPLNMIDDDVGVMSNDLSESQVPEENMNVIMLDGNGMFDPSTVNSDPNPNMQCFSDFRFQ